jgi:hypothetical protein
MTIRKRTTPFLALAAVAMVCLVLGLSTIPADGAIIELIDNSGITAIAKDNASDRPPIQAVDGSGLTFTGVGGEENDPTKYEHQGSDRLGKDANWAIGGIDGWWIADLGADYELDRVSFFNFNPGLNDTNDDDHTDRGVATGNVWYRTTSESNNTDGNGSAFDSTGYTQLGSTETFTRAPGGSLPNHGAIPQTVPDTLDFDGANARYVAIEILTNQGDTSFTGIGELQFFSVPEPATMSLLALGGIAMLRRRRRA